MNVSDHDAKIKLLAEFTEYLRLNGYEVVKIGPGRYPQVYQPLDKSVLQLVLDYVKGGT